MNKAGFYHRDLREGNIMIDPSPKKEGAPTAYIIDFGFCTRATSSEAAYRNIDGARDNVIIKGVIKMLKEQQVRLASSNGV